MEEDDWSSEDEGNWDNSAYIDGGNVNGTENEELEDKILELYRCMSQQESIEMKKGIEKEIEECMQCENQEAKLILINNNWDKDVVMNYYIPNQQVKNLRIQYGIDPTENIPPRPTNGIQIECSVCMDDFDAQSIQYTECGHGLCLDCWCHYLTQSSKNRDCIQLRCSDNICKYALTIQRLEKIQGLDQSILQNLQKRALKFELHSFLNSRKDLFQCCATDCTNVVQIYDTTLKEIVCNCGYRTCPQCNLHSHRPCLCDIAYKWMAKNSSESENIQWILAKTKKCPKCRSPIEKNQGCNHMTCRNPSCCHEFCWLCLGAWSKHGSATGGFYKCNIYEEKKKAGDLNDEEKAKENAKNELERYTFYFERFENHKKAIEQMQSSIDFAEVRMGELMRTFGWDPSSTSFLREAADTVIDARRLLAWTYPIGYYMPPNFQQRDLFHQYQKDLEIYTEQLHQLTDLPVEDVIKQKEDIINHKRATQTYCNHLMKGIETEININAFGNDMDLELN